MFCPGCGAWNPDESKYCGKCGRDLRTASQSQQRSGSCLVIAVAATLVLVAAIAVGAFRMRDRLTHAWQSFFAQPTPIVATPTPSSTPVPISATGTPLPSPTPSPTASATPTPIPALSPTPTPTPTPPLRTFRLVYRNCIPHALSLGSVKGQVFAKSGKVIPGAKVRITINGYEWQSDANPANTNPDGWYEWTLEAGQRIKFVELIVDGQSVPFAPHDLEVIATGGCFQRVDFVEQ